MVASPRNQSFQRFRGTHLRAMPCLGSRESDCSVMYEFLGCVSALRCPAPFVPVLETDYSLDVKLVGLVVAIPGDLVD